MNLKDVKAIVTGGAQGMGAHFAARIAEAGGQATAFDVNEERLAELPAAIHRRRVDVANEGEIAPAVVWAAEKMGGLNCVINNAAILRDGLLVKKDKSGEVKKLSIEQWRAVIDVDLTGATLVVRDAVAHMVQTDQRPGVIVNMSSLARYGNRGQSNYTAAKAAIAANTVTWAREFAPFGIRVGAIAPGMVETPMTQGMNPKAREALIAAIPVGRVGVPEDIWMAVKFIIECDYFSGRTIDVDGGLSM